LIRGSPCVDRRVREPTQCGALSSVSGWRRAACGCREAAAGGHEMRFST
jgi:hypothetical protein